MSLHERWEKRGLLISSPPARPWSHSHAALPCAEIDSSGIDLYFSPRDGQGRAHVACARVGRSGAGDALAVASYRADAVLSPGSLGSFDDNGVTVSCVVRDAGDTFLYYTGWTLGVTVPFYFYVGLAIRRRGEPSFTRYSAAPLLERNAVDPYLTASPWVLRDESGRWRMWYVSGSEWRVRGGRPEHRYHIRYADSEDAIHWVRSGRVSIDFADEEEHALSRPCVIRDGDRYRMWFAARGEEYRLGYAESSDGIAWERADREAGLEPSSSGWDSEMVEYPAVIDFGGRRYMLYNGNGYGRTGIGYAVAQAAG